MTVLILNDIRLILESTTIKSYIFQDFHVLKLASMRFFRVGFA